MIDRYLHGTVDRISPEAPVPVIRLGREDNRLGGAANVALNVKALGSVPLLAGLVGADDNATLFRQLLAEEGIATDLLLTDPDRCTTVKTRVISQGQQLLRADREDTHPAPSSVTDRLLETIRERIEAGAVDLVLFQDYNKGVLTPSFIENLLAVTQGQGSPIPTVVDPKKDNFWAYRGVTLLKPNLREIQQQLDRPLPPTRAALDAAARDLIFPRSRAQNLMVTLSEHGIYINDGQDSNLFPTDAKTVADVSGAGDTVVSIAACGLASGMPLPDIARWSNRAGAQVIARSGVVPVDLAAL